MIRGFLLIVRCIIVGALATMGSWDAFLGDGRDGSRATPIGGAVGLLVGPALSMRRISGRVSMPEMIRGMLHVIVVTAACALICFWSAPGAWEAMNGDQGHVHLGGALLACVLGAPIGGLSGALLGWMLTVRWLGR